MESTSAFSPYSPSHPNPEHKQREKEKFSMSFAAECLGRGYDRQKDDFDIRILEDISKTYEKHVWIQDGNAKTCEASASSFEEVKQDITHQLNLPFKASFWGVSGGASYQQKSGGILLNQTGEIFYTVCHIDYHLCSYKNGYPYLKSISPNSSELQGSFVKSVYVYIGYKIQAHIRYRIDLDQQKSASDKEMADEFSKLLEESNKFLLRCSS